MTDIPAATPRSRVRVPLRFGDGYSVDSELVTFHGLTDGQEHVAVVLGEPGPTPWSGCTPSASPVTSSARPAATAARNCARRSSG